MTIDRETPAGDTDTAALGNIRVVLVRPQGGANIGAAARAMKNMGLRQLCLVAPSVREPFLASALAVHATDVLAAARTVATLAEAVADCQVVVGTTCRNGPYRDNAETIEVVAEELIERAQHGVVALVFGPEDHGLTNEDLKHCHRLMTIDTSPEYASLNVAQAVLLCCYALRRAAGVSARAAWPPASSAADELASAADIEFMLARLQAALLKIGFLHPDNPDHIMFAVRRLLGRTTLDRREVRILLGLARQIEWYAGHVARQAAESGSADDVLE